MQYYTLTQMLRRNPRVTPRAAGNKASHRRKPEDGWYTATDRWGNRGQGYVTATLSHFNFILDPRIDDAAEVKRIEQLREFEAQELQRREQLRQGFEAVCAAGLNEEDLQLPAIVLITRENQPGIGIGYNVLGIAQVPGVAVADAMAGAPDSFSYLAMQYRQADPANPRMGSTLGIVAKAVPGGRFETTTPYDVFPVLQSPKFPGELAGVLSGTGQNVESLTPQDTRQRLQDLFYQIAGYQFPGIHYSGM